MSDPFVHLRVASGYSLRYGASHPSALVERAADHGMDTLALTDRDGLYGAIRFAKACLRTGIAPVVGVDLGVDYAHAALRPSTPARRPGHGPQVREIRRPRVVPMATSKAGWAALCRLTSATNLAGERGAPVGDVEQIAMAVGGGDLLVMLGADSELGLAVAAGRPDLARAELRRWCDLVGREHVVVAATHQEVAGQGLGSLPHAARMVALADECGVTAVLANHVRMADRADAPTIDVLDAARRLVPLDMRHVERRNAEGYLKSGKEMLAVAQAVAQQAGRGANGAARLLGDTRAVALRCRLDPRADLGLGEVHLPEFGTGTEDAQRMLAARCEAGLAARYGEPSQVARQRIEEELDVVRQLGFASYFLTVGDITDMIRQMGIHCAARGSGAGSLINYALGISGVDPLAHGLIMERFLSPLRQALPDIDVDVESARRTEIYRAILNRFGGERVACVAMLDTYRVRHAVRDVGAALSMPPAEIDAIAKAFPHIRARDARAALRDLPELRAAGLAEKRLDVLFRLVESLDGLPRHVAVHPCGVVLSDTTLLDRTPVEASGEGFPMSQFDKDDVEDLGLLKLDVLGIRMQSSLAHAVDEVERVTGERIDLDAMAPFDDADVYEMIAHSATLGCFQIESPGQRELVGKLAPANFHDIIVDISLFRPGPVKSNMVEPFVDCRQGFSRPRVIHPDLTPVLGETCGVMVFHEQVIKTIAVMTGCTLAQGDEARRALGDERGQVEVKRWFFPAARARGYAEPVIEEIWDVLASFASFGFCKAHAAAFALPTYQSAWFKWHHPAAFLAGILTHDPGMYPKRLLVDEARLCGVRVLSVDVNRSDDVHRVERCEGDDLPAPRNGRPDGRGWGIRLALTDVAGLSADEAARIQSGRPWAGISDVCHRGGVSIPALENLVLAGAFDELYGIGSATPVVARDRITRRDLLMALADLRRDAVADRRARSRARGLRPVVTAQAVSDDPRDLARRQVKRRQPETQAVQLALDLTERRASAIGPGDVMPTGLPEMATHDRVEAELRVLGLEVSAHVLSFYEPLLEALGVTKSVDLLTQRSGAQVLCAGVKVATQTPPVRSGRRVVFLTVDDATGPVDATFFEDAQGPYARTVFNSWLVLVRGTVRRTGARGISLNASGAWDVAHLQAVYDETFHTTGDRRAALAAVHQVLDDEPVGFRGVGTVTPEESAGVEASDGRRRRADTEHAGRAGGMGQRRVLVHPSGFAQSPYADTVPAGTRPSEAPRKLWHASPGSSGR